MRSNIMGKRCEQTARTVIGPDPTLKMGQLAVPQKIAKNLTIPVKVASFNIEKLSRIVNNNKANYVLKNEGKTRINMKYALFRKGTELIYGDIIHHGNSRVKVITGKERFVKGDKLERNGVLIDDVKYPEQKRYNLEIGDIVERQLMDGDVVLLNESLFKTGGLKRVLPPSHN